VELVGLSHVCITKSSFNNNVRLLHEEVNCCEVHPIKAMKAGRGIRGIALLFL